MNFLNSKRLIKQYVVARLILTFLIGISGSLVMRFVVGIHTGGMIFLLIWCVVWTLKLGKIVDEHFEEKYRKLVAGEEK